MADRSEARSAPGAAQGGAAAAFVLASLATFLAGYVDAVGFSYLAGLYLSFMSGNSTSLGVALAHLDGWGSLSAAIVIATFVVGAVAGGVVAAWSGARAAPVLLSVEAGLLGLATLFTGLKPGFAALLPAVFAMGLQNAISGRVAGTDIGRSFVTGALFGLGRGIAQALLGEGPWRVPGLFLASWSTFVSGAVAGALALDALGLSHTVGAACALAAALALAFWAGLGLHREKAEARHP